MPPAIVLAAALPLSVRKGSDTGSDISSLPRGNGSYSRFSSDLQTDRSNSDQQRKIRDFAERLGLTISPALEFKDEAVSGAKHVREGFDAMLLAARQGRIQTLIVESLSRLARDSVLTMQTLRELVHGHKVRVLSIDDGIDTSRGDSWELVAAIMGIQNEQYLKTLAKNVLRGQEGVVLDRLCVGDYCFGYSSEPVPGTESSGKGRNEKQPKRYIVELAEAAWVVRIFNWFVTERKSLNWIAKELTRNGAPKDHRASTPQWTHSLIAKLLKNRKYIGMWSWGEKQNVRELATGKIRQEDRAPHETDKWLRHFPELAIVDREIFDRAQSLLAKLKETHGGNRTISGELNGSSPRSSAEHPRHLLSGLIECSECNRRFHVGGTNGRYLFCPGYKTGMCTCQTQLCRDLAEELILREIVGRIVDNSRWRSLLLELTQAAWTERQRERPEKQLSLTTALADLDSRITRLINRCETSDTPDLENQLRKRRSERDAIQLQLEQLESAQHDQPTAPTPKWIERQLDDLRSLLRRGGPAAAHALRALVGGKIVVTEMRRPGKQRHYLQGRMQVRLAALAATTDVPVETLGEPATMATESEEIVIDFRRPEAFEELAEPAKRLFDQGIIVKEIARELGCGRALITRALEHWYVQRGETPPDGRSCRKRLKVKRLAEKLRDQIMELWQADVLVKDIAAQLGCCMEIVHEAVSTWHLEQGLAVPDGRARRREVRLKNEDKGA